MSATKKVAARKTAEKPLRFRLVLSSTKVKDVEEVTRSLLSKAKMEKANISGPARMPTKVLSVTVRRSPCGQGTSTFERYKLRVYKRVLYITGTPDVVRSVTSVRILPSVDVVIKL